MSTIRSTIEDFAYDHIQFFVDLVAREGENAMFHGIRVLDDESKFVRGTLVEATASLYVRYVKTGDERAGETFERLQSFIQLAVSEQCKTWGKLAILKSLYKLKSVGALDKLGAAVLTDLKKKTEYTDFFDKENVCLIGGMLTNYMEVAMACAAYRENLGWDTDHYSDIIKDKLFEIMRKGSDNGWMDEEPPHGRFDNYSIVASAAIADFFLSIGKEVPDQVKENLKEAVEAMLFMANKQGDGINYGRSRSNYGDGTPHKILSSALACGLLEEEQYERVTAYCIHVVEKLLGFWYNKDKRSLDIWWNGRAADWYRGLDRVMEVNLDFAMSLLGLLHKFEQAGLADYEPEKDIENPSVWEAKEMCFLESEKQVSKTIILRRGDTIAMLPLIGLGRYHRYQTYMPYPAICGFLEGSPEGGLPFLVPEYVLQDGRHARPTQYYESVETVTGQDQVTVTAKGKLSVTDGRYPEKSRIGFTSTYCFRGEKIQATFTVDSPFRSCSMMVAVHQEETFIEAKGFDRVEPLAVEDAHEFHTPCGPQKRAWLYTTEKNGAVGYEVLM